MLFHIGFWYTENYLLTEKHKNLRSRKAKDMVVFAH